MFRPGPALSALDLCDPGSPRRRLVLRDCCRASPGCRFGHHDCPGRHELLDYCRGCRDPLASHVRANRGPVCRHGLRQAFRPEMVRHYDRHHDHRYGRLRNVPMERSNGATMRTQAWKASGKVTGRRRRTSQTISSIFRMSPCEKNLPRATTTLQCRCARTLETMNKTPVLETERLILRPVELTDAPAIQRQLPHWNVVRYMSAVPWPYPADGAIDFLTNVLMPAMEMGTNLSWAITVRSIGNELIGNIEFRFAEGPTGNRGFWLAEQYWGNGYMTEAVAAVNDYVFVELEVEAITVTNAVDNVASSRIKANSVGRLVEVVEADFAGGQRRQSEVWEITSESWLAYKNQVN